MNPRLVRGLDYYNKTVFEIASYDLGAQNSLGGGGRYDGLTETIGGPHIPSAGFGTGLERVLQAMDKQQVNFPSPPHPTLFLIPMGEAAKQFCFELICTLRHEMIPCDMDLSGKKMQNGLQMANHVNAEYCMVIGDQELEFQKAELKNLATRQSVEVLFSELPERIKQLHPS